MLINQIDLNYLYQHLHLVILQTCPQLHAFNQDMTSALCPRGFFIDCKFEGKSVYMQCPLLDQSGIKKKNGMQYH